MYLAPIWS